MKKLTVVLVLVSVFAMATGCSSAAKKEEVSDIGAASAKVESPVDLGASSSGRGR